MLQRILDHLDAHPGADSHQLSIALGVPRTMMERFLEQLEDSGALSLERPATCLEGPSCGPSGGCGPAGALQALAEAARARQAS